MNSAVLIPVKRFVDAKQRLQATLDPLTRAELARELASGVIAAAQPTPVVVVCDDDDVRTWATDLGVEVLWTPNRGLNGAVSFGVDQLAARGLEYVIVAHADLPLATAGCFDPVGPWPGITLVPDRRGQGTNVIGLDPTVGFRFAFGRDSFRRHCVEAARIRRGVRILRHDQLGWDLDYPEDLAALSARNDTQIGTPCALA